MTVIASSDGMIQLVGLCAIEDAEALLLSLAQDPGAGVDWSACEHAHTAVIQVLLAVRPRMVGLPRNAFLCDHIADRLVHTTSEP